MTARLRPLALAAVLAQACASTPPDVRHQAQLGRIAVVEGAAQLQLDFRGFPRGKAEGAALGAGQALLACASVPAVGCGGDAMCGAVLVFWAGVCTVGTAAGAVTGAALAPGAQTVRKSEAALAGAFDPGVIHQTLRDQVQAAFSERPGPAAEPGNADTLAEVTLSRAGLDRSLELYMHATVRLVRRSDGAELSSTEYVHTGARHTLAAWSENGAARLHAGLRAGFESLGAHIRDSVFYLYPFPDREWNAGSIFAAAYGLAPLQPKLLTPWLTLSQVPALRPTLQWQSFPRPRDHAAAPEAMSRVRNVRYDLVIARRQDDAPAEIVYRRNALPQAAHTLETALAAGTEYYWAVRARFELDGRERVTSWGSIQHTARETWTAPSRHSYRFRTPR